MAEQKGTLAELREIAENAEPDNDVWSSVELPHGFLAADREHVATFTPATVLKLLAVVEAAKGMRWNGVMTAFGGVNPYAETFDAALAALEGEKEDT